MISPMMILILFILGLCFGSFAGATVWRVHEQEKRKISNKKLSILHGRSMCETCKHELSASDLVPLLSWLSLGGKCRYCKAKISSQAPLIEVLMVLLFVGSYIYWPGDFNLLGIVQFGFWVTFLVFFVILAIYDLRWMELPNRLVYPLILLATVYVLLISAISSSLDPITAGFWGVFVSSGLFYALFQISGGKWIGGGDVKIGIAIGLIIGGPLQSILMLFIASLLGSIVSIPLLIMGSGRQKKIPFGPFLILSTIIVYLFGVSITDWYQTTFLLL